MFTTVADPHQGAVLQAELSTLLEKGAIREVASGDQRAGFFSRYFLAPKGRRASTNSGPQGAESVPPAPAMPDFDGPQGETGNLCRRLVRPYRPEGCLFPDTHLEGSLVLPAVRLCRQSIRVSGAAVRYFSGTTHLHSMHGCGSLPPEAKGHQDLELPRRLAGLRSLRGAMPPTRSRAVGPRSGFRPVPKLQEEQARTGPGDLLLGYGPGLKERYSCFDPGEAAGLQVLCCPVPAARSSQLGSLPSPHGLNGGHGAGSSSRPLAHAACTEVSAELGSVPSEIPQDQSTGLSEAPQSPTVVEGPREHQSRPRSGSSDISPAGVHRRIPGRVGCGTRRLGGQRCLDRPVAGPAHKCPGAEGGSSRSPSFLAETEGSSCDCPHRQHSGGRLHQQTGGAGLPSPVQAGYSSLAVGPPPLPLAQSRACAGGTELRGGHHVQGGPSPGGMEAPSGSGVQDMVSVRQAEVDLFASRESSHCPLFFSLRNDHPPLGWDALAHPWPRVLLYAFPPFALLQPLLRRIQVEHVRVILVAPLWPHMAWFSAIPPLLDGPPWELPCRRDLLSQANGALFHPFPAGLRLVAWLLRGTGFWP